MLEDQHFGVIAATWKKGVHYITRPVPGAIRFHALNDCTIRVHAPDGNTRDIVNKAGVAMAAPIIAEMNLVRARELAPGCSILGADFDLPLLLTTLREKGHSLDVAFRRKYF